MSRNQRASKKAKRVKQRKDAQLQGPSRSAIWNAASNRADELIDQGLWSEAREVLETVDRSHPGAVCILERLAHVYEELGEVDCLASVNSRRKSNPHFNEMMDHAKDLVRRFDLAERGRVGDEFMILDFKIDFDPIYAPRSPQIQEWAEEGYDALLQNKGREAEVLFKKCVEAAPDAPDLANNLAAAYAMQGRIAESNELARAIHARWPEYFFGRIYMANTATLERRFEDAKQYLRPMLTQRRFHITEFRAMVTANFQLEMEQRHLEAAQKWIDLWKTVEPDHDDVRKYQKKLNARSISSRFLNLLNVLRR